MDAQDPLRALISEGLAAGSDPLADFSDEEISGICDGRLAEVRAGSVPSGQPSQLCPTKDSSLGMGDGAGGGSGTLGIGAGGLLRSRNAIFGRYLTEVSGRAARAAALDATKAAPAIEVYVYSHTHQLEQPWSLPTKYRTLAVINTGAFQRVVAAPVLEAQALRNGIDKKEILTKIHLEDFPACFGFVRVAPYTPKDGPTPRARFFRVNASGPHETPTCD